MNDTNNHSVIQLFSDSVISPIQLFSDSVIRKSRKAFTLLEMLVVIGIIATLIAASLGGYAFATKRAQKARGRELVSNVATALNVLYQRRNSWPPALLREAEGAGRLTARAAACLAVNNLMSLTHTTVEVDGERVATLSGLDRCGIVSPWAQDTLKRLSSGNSGLSARVSTGGTVEDHQLHFAVDTEGRGFVEARVKGKTVKIRGTVAVWCWGMNGVEDDYEASMSGRGNCDDIYSWSRGQEVR